MGIPSHFSAVFIKGNNFCDFLFASLGGETLQKGDLLIKKRICFSGSKFFPVRVDPIENEC